MQEQNVPDLEAVARRENERLADDPNVVAVGYGLKIRKGQPTFEVALQYYVRQKLATDEEIRRAGSEPIPPQVTGLPTDVIQLEPVVALQCPADKGMPAGSRGSSQENPLVGGTSTTVLSSWHSFPTGYGTLGGICFDTASGAAMALSNAHVWGSTTGRDIIQPWLPTGEYLEAVVKLLTCGPVISYIVDTTLPSPLTLGLAAGAAAAFTAAVASDAEDPSRWGQRVGPVPPAGAATESELVHLEASIPELPFAGRAYKTRTTWDYTRQTTAGVFNQSTADDRSNPHVLLGKRVWTDREAYRGGQRVHICAEVTTDQVDRPEDYFVVANCFPRTNPERVVRRVLTPGRCPPPPPRETCFRGFPPPAVPREPAHFPMTVDVFHLDSERSGLFVGPWPPNDPNGLTVLRLPAQAPVRVFVPPSTVVRVEVFHTNRPVRAEAYNAAGLRVSARSTTTQQNQLQVLELQGDEIIEVVITGGGGEGYLVGVCVVQGPVRPGREKVRRFTYTGHLDLDLREITDQWAVSLSVQTVDNTPVGGDPIAAAQQLGGITASASVAQVAGCVVVMLLDHVFNVI
jgi:hypothetical protein